MGPGAGTTDTIGDRRSGCVSGGVSGGGGSVNCGWTVVIIINIVNNSTAATAAAAAATVIVIVIVIVIGMVIGLDTAAIVSVYTGDEAMSRPQTMR